MAKVKAVFFLPLKDNDGRSLAKEISDVEMELYIQFAGWTFQGYVKGAYRMAGGSQSIDESAAYFVVADESRIPEIEEILRRFRRQTQQESIHLEIQRQVDVRLVQ